MTRLLIFAAGLVAVPALAQAWEPLPEVKIPAANRGGISELVASSDDFVFLHGRDGRWYRATLAAPCPGVRRKVGITYETRADGSFDRTSAIRVNGRRCAVQSVVDSDEGPAPN